MKRIACGAVSFMYSAEWAQWVESSLHEAIQETVVQYPSGLQELIATAVFKSLMDTIYQLPMKLLLGQAFHTAGKVMYARGGCEHGASKSPEGLSSHAYS